MTSLIQNSGTYQRYSFNSSPNTEFQPGTTRKDLSGTGFSGFSAWAQPVDSLSESTGNSQPGPQMPKARCGTGIEGSNARAAQRESSGFDPTFSFTKSGTGSEGSIAGPNYGSGNLTTALLGTIPGTGSSGSIAGQESDNSGFVYESGRVLSMPTRGHLANAAALTGEFSGSGLGTPSVILAPLSTHLSGAGFLFSATGSLPKADGPPTDPLTQGQRGLPESLCCLFSWEKEPLFPPFSFGQKPFSFSFENTQKSSRNGNLSVSGGKQNPPIARKVPPYGSPNPPRCQVQKVPLRRKKKGHCAPLLLLCYLC